jgi:hypothetical protein
VCRAAAAARRAAASARHGCWTGGCWGGGCVRRRCWLSIARACCCLVRSMLRQVAIQPRGC